MLLPDGRELGAVLDGLFRVFFDRSNDLWENAEVSFVRRPPPTISCDHRVDVGGTHPTMIAMAHSTRLKTLLINQLMYEWEEGSYVQIMALVKPTEEPLRDEYL